LSTHQVYRHSRIVLINIGHARRFCTTSRPNYPEAGILCTTPTVNIWIYRPGGLRQVTFLCSCVSPMAARVCWSRADYHLNLRDQVQPHPASQKLRYSEYDKIHVKPDADRPDPVRLTTENKQTTQSPSFVSKLHSVFAARVVKSQDGNGTLFAIFSCRKYNFIHSFRRSSTSKPDIQNIDSSSSFLQNID